MKVSTVDEDLDMFGMESPGRNLSSLSRQYHSRQAPQKKTGRCIAYLAICVALLIALVVIATRGDGKLDQSQTQKQVKQLASEINRLKQIEGSNVQQIKQLQKQINKKSQPSKPIQPAQAAKPIPANTPAAVAPQTISKNKPKNQYITLELAKISEKRRQAGGMKSVGSGSVSQIEYLLKNKDGKSIQEVLYDTASIKARADFQTQRVTFLNTKKNLQSIYLASFNNKIDTSRDEEQKRVESQEFTRLDKIWNFTKYTEELPMCIIVPGYNNNAKFRIQYNLNSIFTQNYSNYFVVLINDASNDNSDELYRKYFDFYKIDKSNYAYVENTDRKTALENIYIATHDYCSPDSIAVNLDADDEFIGKNVLKIFNAGYQQKKAGVVYSNFYWYDQGRNIMLGFTSQYTESDKKNKNYRQAPQRFSHLRTYRSELFLMIDAKSSFQDDQGKFFTSAYDMAMYFPLMELACGRVSKIQGFHYLYNINTGLNDYAVDRNKQVRIDQTVRRRPKYNCSVEFDQRMKSK